MKPDLKNVKKKSSNKKRVVVASILITALLIAVYIWYSFSFWRGYGNDTENMRQSIIELRTDIKSQDSSFDEISGAAQSLYEKTQKDADCQAGWHLRWMTVFPSVKKHIEHCKSISTSKQKVAQPVKELVDFISLQREIGKLIETSAPSGQLKESTWQNHLKKLASAKEDLEKLQKESGDDPLVNQASKSLSAYHAALDDLKKANKKQDASAFEKATDQIIDAYEGLKKLPAVEADRYDKLLQSVLDSLKQLS